MNSQETGVSGVGQPNLVAGIPTPTPTLKKAKPKKATTVGSAEAETRKQQSMTATVVQPSSVPTSNRRVVDYWQFVANSNPEGHNQYTSGGGSLKDAIHQHLQSNPRTSLGDLRDRFAKGVKFNKNKPLEHPVHAALKELRDEGKVKVHGGDWGEPSFSANTQGRDKESGQFLPTKGSSKKQMDSAASDGHSDQGPEYHGGDVQSQADQGASDPLDAEAAKRGMSTKELKAKLKTNAVLFNQVFITNPFVSEDQRRFLWANHPDIAHAWAHGEHTAAKDHKIPSETGKDVKGPLAKAEREKQKRGKKVANMAHDYNDPQGGTKVVPDTGKTASADGRNIADIHRQEEDQDDDIDSLGGQAEDDHERNAGGMDPRQKEGTKQRMSRSDDFTRPALNAGSSCSNMPSSPMGQETQPIGRKKPTLNDGDDDDETCPRCGGEMHDGECEECGYVENAAFLSDQPGGSQGMMPQDRRPQAHKASKDAAAASLHTEHDGAFGHAQKAMGASQDGHSGKAQMFHQKAASAHEDQATQSRKDGQDDEAEMHDHAAGMHRVAASQHGAIRNQRKTIMKTTTRNASAPGHLAGADRAQVQAAMAAMSEDQGSSRAHAASAKAKESGSARSHSAASKAHSAAAQGHREQASHHEEMGNSERAEMHTHAASGHEALARKHMKKSKITSNRLVREVVGKIPVEMYQALVANGCICEGKDTEAQAILNAKGLGSLQDVTDAMTSLAGSHDPTGEEVDEDDTPDDYEDRVDPNLETGDDGHIDDDETVSRGKFSKNRRTMTDNQYLQTLPPRIRNVVSRSLNREQEHRQGLLNALTANVQDQQQRQFVANGLNRLSTEQLEVMSQGVPVTNREEFQQPLVFTPPNYLGQGGNGFAPTMNKAGNPTAKSRNNILPIPTMNWGEIAEENETERKQKQLARQS